MKNIFVPYEIANKLREIHFDEPCIAFYEFANPERLVTIIKKEETLLDEYEKGTFTQSNYAGIGTPTYEQVFKWFRDRKIITSVTPFFNIKEEFKYYYYIINDIRIENEGKLYGNSNYANYVEAQNDAILKLIEIFKNI